MDVFYDPELPATHRLAWEQIELLRDSLPARLTAAGRQVREAVELLRAHGPPWTLAPATASSWPTSC